MNIRKHSNTMSIKGAKIALTLINNQDYICLTDMAKSFDGENTIKNWLRNRNTVEFLGVWERFNNANFNLVEFDLIKKESGLNRFSLSAKGWIKKTNAIGIKAKAGRYGGTYAHKDIAFEFGSWLSAEFKLLLITEFQRLKQEEQEGLAWDVRRILTKVNYRVHTAAVKDILIPSSNLSKNREGLLYADEAEMFNVIIFGITSHEWRKKNKKRTETGENLRDSASLVQLSVLSNLENINAIMIRDGINKSERFTKLKKIARQQVKNFVESEHQLHKLTMGNPLLES